MLTLPQHLVVYGDCSQGTLPQSPFLLPSSLGPLRTGKWLWKQLRNSGQGYPLVCSKGPTAHCAPVAAARMGNAAAVKSNLDAASKCDKLAARAAKDVEFAQYR